MASLFSSFHFFLAENRNKATVLIIIALTYAFIEIWPKLGKRGATEKWPEVNTSKKEKKKKPG